MLFNSMTFAVFLLTVFILYHIVPVRFRWVFLLAASYAFYMNLHAAYGLLLLLAQCLPTFWLWNWKKHRLRQKENSVFWVVSCPLWRSFCFSNWALPSSAASMP